MLCYSSTLVSSFVVIAVSVLLYYLLRYLRYKNIINRIPGFGCYSLSGNLPFLWGSIPPGIERNTILQQVLCGAAVLYPEASIFRFWISLIPYTFFIKADAAEVILSSNKQIRKSHDYIFLNSWLGQGLLTSFGKRWKTRRRMLTPAFHFRILNDFQSVFNEESLSLINLLSKEIHKENIDILEYITNCTLNIICETAMGTKVDNKGELNSPYLKGLHRLSDILLKRISNPLYRKEELFKITPMGKQYYKDLKVVHNFTKEVIKHKLNENVPIIRENDSDIISSTKKRLAFMDLLIDEHNRNKLEFTEADIQEEVDTFMFEGHDTTAVGLSWCVYILGHHPEIQERLFEENLKVLGSEKDVTITDQELKEMKYLEQVIKESQRMFPSVPFVGRELDEDLVFNKMVVPKGTTCFVCIAVIHRNPEVFPSPDTFDPERFTMENSAGRHPYAYIPFSAGPRNCIGQKFAVNEEKTVLAHLIRNFSWVSVDPLDKVTIAPNMVTRPVPGHRIKLNKRNI